MELDCIVYTEDSEKEAEEKESLGIEGYVQPTESRNYTIELTSIRSFCPLDNGNAYLYMSPHDREVKMSYDAFKKIYNEKVAEYNGMDLNTELGRIEDILRDRG